MPKHDLIRFTSRSGDMLAAHFDAAIGVRRGLAVFAHCFSCSKDIFAARKISRELARRGIGVLRFDFTGLGESEGEFAHANFTSNVEDLVLAAGWLKDHHGPADLLVGHSLAGLHFSRLPVRSPA